MPTISYIQETVDDRYWEAHAPHPPYTPPPPEFPCVHCSRIFATPDERSWHASEAHPLARPTLYIADRAAPSAILVRTPIPATAVSVGSCTSVNVVVDGVPAEDVRPDELGGVVDGRRTAHIVVELENHRAADAADVRAVYTLEIAVPDAEELAQVDRAFVSNLAIDRPSTRDIETFASDVAGLTSARRYAGALADYVHGVLVKEGSDVGGATLPFEAFQAKFARTLAELADHTGRPVAASVVALARHNLNDIGQPAPLGGDPRLDGCLVFLHDAATSGRGRLADMSRSGSAIPLCPIDRDTHLVLGAYESLIVARAANGRFAELDERAEDGSLSGYDRTKLRVLVSFRAIHDGRYSTAVPHLRILAHDPVFGAWAERELEAIA
jgi:hypothetical protein